jgi:uroporphyrinogen decarboxylase
MRNSEWNDLVGNIPPRDIMAAGTPQQVKVAVKKAFGETDDYSRIIWSVGGGMPPNVSSANILDFLEAVTGESWRLKT